MNCLVAQVKGLNSSTFTFFYLNCAKFTERFGPGSVCFTGGGRPPLTAISHALMLMRPMQHEHSWPKHLTIFREILYLAVKSFHMRIKNKQKEKEKEKKRKIHEYYI